MTMRRNSHLAVIAGFAVAVILLAAGGLLIWGSTYVHNTVQGQLAAQQIFFPPKAAFATAKAGTEITPSMIPSVSQYAGQQLLPGVLRDGRDHAGSDLGARLGGRERGLRREEDLLRSQLALHGVVHVGRAPDQQPAGRQQDHRDGEPRDDGEMRIAAHGHCLLLAADRWVTGPLVELIPGVSRSHPYLRHGQMSPARRDLSPWPRRPRAGCRSRRLLRRRP